MATKVRLDTLLAERGRFPSRTAAARAVRGGEVKLGPDGPVALRPGQMVDADLDPLVAERQRFASRGGEKLAAAMAILGVSAQGRDCLDAGASTGGFTDCLLQGGAAHVIALDVAYGQLDDRLRRDPRVTEMPRTNVRGIGREDLPFTPDLVTCDLSFISLTKVLEPIAGVLGDDGEMLAMVKPQFELSRREVGSGGVVRDVEARRRAVLSVARRARELGLAVEGFAYSGLAGPKGNRETFVHCRKTPGDGGGIEDLEASLAGVEV